MTKLRVSALLILLALAGTVVADVFRPAYLELRELGEDRYEVLWKVPALGENQRLSVYVILPPETENLTDAQPLITEGAWAERWQIRHPGGLVGETIRIEGKATGVTDVIARVERLDGSSQVERLVAGSPQFVVRAPAGTGEIAWSYTILGFEHILGGIDHLLFVFALLLIVSGGKRIVITITAFTVAHSITLVAATLGLVSVPGPPVEAIIALSIVFVAAEIIRGQQGKPGLTARSPWIVAFSFGLLHGFGFAGALAETGLPQTSIPVALLMFNVGVELGQLFFVAIVLAAAKLGRLMLRTEPAWVLPASAYAVGAVAAFWTIERVVSFWS